MFGWLKRIFKRSPKPEPRVLLFEGEEARQICVLFDAVIKSGDACAVAKFYLWMYICDSHPETRVGTWKLDFSGNFRILLREILS